MFTTPLIPGYQLSKNFREMLAIFCDIARDVRHFNYVVDDKGRQRLHTQELIRLVERQIRAVYAHAFEELIFLGEGFQRGVPGQ